ncbi:MAG: iron ABC transporter permease [Candidatus Promineifilaceae bacterium]|nr:iron ABC transporter permease [Candidatus Promineifilaceae bacterium]
MSLRSDPYSIVRRSAPPAAAHGARPDGGRRRAWSAPAQLFLILAASAVVGLILLVPAYIVVRSAGAGLEALETLTALRTLELLGNTLLLAAAVTAGATALAIPLAWLTTATDLPARRLWALLAALPLVMPSYVAAFVYISILSPRGLLQQLLAPLGVERLPRIYGFPGAFIVLTLITYPYILLTVRAAIRRRDPSRVEAARSMGLSPWQAFRRVTLPHLRPSVVAGALLVALYVLRDFGAVTLLQYNSFTRIIYNRYLSYRLETAATLAAVLVLMTVLILLLEQRSRGRARYARLSVGAARRQQPVALGRWKLPALAFTAATVSAALLMPVGGLLYWFVRGWRGQSGVHLPQALTDGVPATIGNNVLPLVSLMEPAWHSLSASLLAAALTAVLALPIAILVVRRPGRLSRLFEQITYASFALPGIVVALAFVFFGIHLLPTLYQTLPMLLAAYVILFIPQALGAERASLLQLSPALEEAARSLGKRPLGVFRRVTLPLVRPGLLAGAGLVFLTAMKELPATLILSPLGFNTLAAEIWSNIGEAFFARAAAPTLLLLLLSSLPLAWMALRESEPAQRSP